MIIRLTYTFVKMLSFDIYDWKGHSSGNTNSNYYRLLHRIAEYFFRIMLQVPVCTVPLNLETQKISFYALWFKLQNGSHYFMIYYFYYAIVYEKDRELRSQKIKILFVFITFIVFPFFTAQYSPVLCIVRYRTIGLISSIFYQKVWL